VTRAASGFTAGLFTAVGADALARTMIINWLPDGGR
jgi:hypothetical protein